MATLILSAIGSIYGGPVGGAIGSLVGQQIDFLILGKGKAREGPRLKELEVQTSSYGTQIPAVLGSMRIAGTVIWAADLKEKRRKSGGGKSGPATINYSYSASFAVALSSNPLERVGRIWADGNLLRGAAGDFKTKTGFRFYSGHGDQPIDPLIASAVGAQSCPAFRGLAYVVFEDMQLADFGNRIPSLTFEVFDRDQPLSVIDVVKTATNAAISGASDETLTGYALQGDDAEAGLRPLLGAMPVIVRPDTDRLRLVDWFSGDTATLAHLPVRSVNGNAVDLPKQERQSDDSLATAIAVRYFEPARDFQSGTQQSSFSGAGQKLPVLELPAAISSEPAKRLADLIWLQNQRSRTRYSASVLLNNAQPEVADWIIDNGEYSRIVEIEKFLGWYRIETQRWLRTVPPISSATDAGVPLLPPDLPIGETRLILADLPVLGLPVLGGDDPGSPLIIAAAAGTGAGWRGANLSLQDGNNLIDLGATATGANMGVLASFLPRHQPGLIDKENYVDVQLLNSDQTVELGSVDPTLGSAPMIMINQEILRYGRAEHLGGLLYRLSALLRGAYGTEDKAASHAQGSPILWLDPATTTPIDPNYVKIGSDLSIEALGLGDTEPVTKTLSVEGNAIRPRSPVHGLLFRESDGAIKLSWRRRDRIDTGWKDEVDLPMSEDELRFEVQLRSNGQLLQTWSLATESLFVSAAELALLPIATGSLLIWEVRQIGRYALSRPLTVSVTA
jgi:hypothetical protein